MNNKKLSIIGMATRKRGMSIPFLAMQIPAGFPSPADDYVEHKLDLNELIIKHPTATFFVRAHGSSMEQAGIRSGDLLVVDRAVHVAHNCIVVAVIDGEFTVKRLHRQGDRLFLVPENDSFEPIELHEEMNISIWGVVTFVIHEV